jgi:hypothetical protein
MLRGEQNYYNDSEVLYYEACLRSSSSSSSSSYSSSSKSSESISSSSVSVPFKWQDTEEDLCTEALNLDC